MMRILLVAVLFGWAICAGAVEPAPAGEVPLGEYPRPDRQREHWLSLNGPWQFRFDPDDRGIAEGWNTRPVEFDRRITVPFCWESKLSGIADTSGEKIGWYCRTVQAPTAWSGQRVWLCFGGVRGDARVWVDGRNVGRHAGGNTPFEFDVTDSLAAGRETSIVVRVSRADDSATPGDQQTDGCRIATSGIWQTVWLEARPAHYLRQLRLTPVRRGQRWALDVELRAAGPDGQLDVEIISSNETVGKHRARLKLGDGHGRLTAALGIESPRLWTPEDPYLYDLAIRLRGPDGQADVVRSYFALRTIARGRYGNLPYAVFLLNDRPIFLRGVLDRSFNPEGLCTAPSDAFMRRDIELAKSLGFNFLRLTGKTEQPRRLYWADRLGVLVMENTPQPATGEPSRSQAWETAMQAAIGRDGDAWGLCLDDYQSAREHLDAWVKGNRPDASSSFATRPSKDTPPLIVSPYSAVAVSGGDRDVSWGFRLLTTQIRRHESIQGYVYSKLTDIQSEHDGLVDYDRSGKEFGYDAFVPGMTVAELQGADFVGFDAPPAVEVTPGEEINLPLFVSHFSSRDVAPRLAWYIHGTNDLGQPVSTDPQTRAVVWQPWRATYQKPLRVSVPSGRAFVGALAVELLDEKGERIAANFINLIARPRAEQVPGRQGVPVRRSPTVEVLAPRVVVVRFDSGQFASFRTDDAGWDWLDSRGKFHAFGTSEVEYHLALPAFIRDASPNRVVLIAELATKADSEGLDWPAVRHPLDYPQTQDYKHSGKVTVRLLDKALWEFDLPDDPADSRGVLSHQIHYHPGSYGYLVRKTADLTRHVALREAIERDPFVPLVFKASSGHGLSIYGKRLGRHSIEPTLVIETARDLTRPTGWTSGEPITVHQLLARSRVVEAIRSAEHGGHSWRYTTGKPPTDWMQDDFEDDAWQTAISGFGDRANPLVRCRTDWESPDIWLRTEMQLRQRPIGMLLEWCHPGGVEIYVNGKPLLATADSVGSYQQRPLRKAEIDLFREGRNTIAVHARKAAAAGAIDVGIRWIEVAGQ